MSGLWRAVCADKEKTMQDTLTPACVAFAIAFGLALGALVALGF